MVVIIILSDIKIQDINPAFTTIFGYTFADVLNKQWEFLIDQKSFERLSKRKVINAVEVIGKHKDGSEISLLTESRIFKKKNKEMHVFAFYDISDIIMAQKEIIYKSAFENLLTEISITFVNIDHNEIDKYIVSSLETISSFIESDISYYYAFDDKFTYAQLKYNFDDGRMHNNMKYQIL